MGFAFSFLGLLVTLSCIAVVLFDIVLILVLIFVFVLAFLALAYVLVLFLFVTRAFFVFVVFFVALVTLRLLVLASLWAHVFVTVCRALSTQLFLAGYRTQRWDRGGSLQFRGLGMGRLRSQTRRGFCTRLRGTRRRGLGCNSELRFGDDFARYFHIQLSSPCFWLQRSSITGVCEFGERVCRGLKETIRLAKGINGCNVDAENARVFVSLLCEAFFEVLIERDEVDEFLSQVI